MHLCVEIAHTPKEKGRQRGKDVQEENPSVWRMVLATKHNEPQVRQVPLASDV